MKVNNINEGLNLYHLKTNKFKTFNLSFYFHRELSKEEVSLNALLPYVIKRGSRNFKDISVISKELESLYGGIYEVSVRKKGENQVIGFSFEFISPKYIINDPEYMNKVIRFVFDTVFHPLVENDRFIEEYVQREKENLCDYINGIINDKKEYANLRCLEEMCKGEAYALFEYGIISEIEKITSEELYKHYLKFISESKLDVFLIGDIDTVQITEKLHRIPRMSVKEKYPKTKLKEAPNKVKEFEEKFDVAQGKLSMGFVTNVPASSEKSYALSVMNSIFGSGAHSKLFNHVREKLSLCYYAYSRLDKYKGIMTVNSGVEFKNFQKAYDEILLQLENVKNAEITQEEFESAKGAIKNTLLSIADNPISIEDYYLNCAITGNLVQIDHYIKKIEEVTIKDVVEIAKGIQLDTVYYLTGEEK